MVGCVQLIAVHDALKQSGKPMLCGRSTPSLRRERERERDTGTDTILLI